MKQLVILSGKGGTGKTSVAAALAHLASEGEPVIASVLADADVDAANLELVLAPHKLEQEAFWGGKVAAIDLTACDGCGWCEQICRFDAIHEMESIYAVDPIACEGCAACAYACPSEAITMEDQVAGEWYRSMSRYGPLYHAALYPAHENSGKLVMRIKQHSKKRALDGAYDLLIVDGPPGVGCPVISAASGADLALIVAEPSVAGVHDMRRILETTEHFGVESIVCINKADLYPQGATEIETCCREHGIEVIGSIPFDLDVTRAMTNGEPVTAYEPGGPASKALLKIWRRVLATVSEQEP